MKANYREVSLHSLANGLAIVLFDEELQRVLQNIGDPGVPAKDTRTITLKVKIVPNEERSGAAVSVAVGSKLAANTPRETIFIIGQEDERTVAYENNPVQPDLPEENGKIIDMERKTE